MRILIVLHPDFTFPCTLNDFPLSQYLYPWLTRDKKNEIVIAANKHCQIQFSNAGQLSITHIPSFRRKAFFYIYKVKLLHRLASIIRLYKPDLIFYDGIVVKSLSSGNWLLNYFLYRKKHIPVGIIINDYNRSPAKDERHSLLHLRNTPSIINKSVFLSSSFLFITDCENSLQRLPSIKNVSVKKIFCPTYFAKSIIMKMEIEIMRIKEQITEGYEYFLCTAALLDNKIIIQLLKAFSLVKKRFRTSIKLVLAGIDLKRQGKISRIIQQYKYRSDLVLLNPSDNLDYFTVIAGAYAHIYPSSSDMYPSDIWDSVRLGIPVILPNFFFNHYEVGCRFDEASMDSLAEKMMLIYKDESFRFRIIEESRKQLLHNHEFEKYLFHFNAIFEH